MAKDKIQFIIMPTKEEDEAITRGALDDPDNPPLLDAELTRMRPIKPHKVSVTLRLDADIRDAFAATGKGWQTRMNNAIRQWLEEHPKFIE